MISGALAVCFVAAILYYLFSKPKWTKSPPGPSRLPLVGNLFQVDKMQHISYFKWAKEFGPIFRVDLATTKLVVISDHKLVKEMFMDSAYSGRMDFTIFDFIPDGNLHGIINTEGEHWEELRRFTLRQLRDFGFGKATMEESIMTEVNELLESLKEQKGKSVKNIKERLLLAVVNSVWFIVTGKRHRQDDAALLKMTTTANEAFNELLESGGLLIFAPWLAKVIPKWSGYTKIRGQIEILSNYFRQPVEEHKKSYSEEFQRDFIDVFLKEVYGTTDAKSAFSGKTGEDNLVATLSDLYFAGTDTTSTTLSWMILYLSKFPHIQKKFQEEIEATTGNTRPCSVSDRPKMPYTEALLAEVLRFSSITPVGVQHRAIRDTEFKGYLIPKDTVITPNFYYIHRDPQIWGDPEVFRPERFLSDDGQVFKKNEALMAFSIGRRQCIGESLARDSLFLFSTNLFQRFWVDFDTNGPDNGFESKLSFIVTPKEFNVKFVDRLE